MRVESPIIYPETGRGHVKTISFTKSYKKPQELTEEFAKDVSA